MTFDMKRYLPAWGSDSISNYPDLTTALGMTQLRDTVLPDPLPWLDLFPNSPEHSRVLLKLQGVQTLFHLSCFDQEAIASCFRLGMRTMIREVVPPNEMYPYEQFTQGKWIYQNYSIVRSFPPEEDHA